MEGWAFEGTLGVNGQLRFARVYGKPRPTLLLWTSEEEKEEFPFQPQSVLELSRAEIEAASKDSIQVGNLVKRDPHNKSQPQKKTFTFTFAPEETTVPQKRASKRKEANGDAVALYQALTDIGVASLVPDLVIPTPLSPPETGKSLTMPQLVGPEAKVESLRKFSTGSIEPTPSAKAFEMGRGLSRVNTYTWSEMLEDDGERRPLSEHFDVRELLGEGGFANVYRAVHRESGRDVAVKIMLLKKKEDSDQTQQPEKEKEQTADENSEDDNGQEGAQSMQKVLTEHSKKIREFEWEIRVMKRIRQELPFHANLVRLLSVCTESDPPRTCLVMEKLDGGELFDRIVERKHYTEKDAGFLFRTLVRAFHALHKVQILHRDIKPENILFSDTGFYANVKVCDFGSACFMDAMEDDPFMDKKIGSPGYTAPEVIQRCHYTPACDVWSLGVLLYCLLVGYLPFPEGFMQTLKVITGKFEFVEEDWRDISEDAKDLIRRMLCSRRSQRITTEEILQHPWITNIDLNTAEPEKDLSTTQSRMKTFNLRRKFKASAMAAVWSAKIRLNRVFKEKALESIRGLGNLRSSRTSRSTTSNSNSSQSSTNHPANPPTTPTHKNPK